MLGGAVGRGRRSLGAVMTGAVNCRGRGERTVRRVRGQGPKPGHAEQRRDERDEQQAGKPAAEGSHGVRIVRSRPGCSLSDRLENLVRLRGQDGLDAVAGPNDAARQHHGHYATFADEVACAVGHEQLFE